MISYNWKSQSLLSKIETVNFDSLLKKKKKHCVFPLTKFRPALPGYYLMGNDEKEETENTVYFAFQLNAYHIPYDHTQGSACRPLASGSTNILYLIRT